MFRAAGFDIDSGGDDDDVEEIDPANITNASTATATRLNALKRGTPLPPAGSNKKPALEERMMTILGNGMNEANWRYESRAKNDNLVASAALLNAQNESKRIALEERRFEAEGRPRGRLTQGTNGITESATVKIRRRPH